MMTRIAVLISMLVLGVSPALAAKLPAWEIGIGGGALRIPDYRGAGEAGTYPYPFIMPIYRGRRLQADEEGIKGILGESSRLRFDVSVFGSVPVNSDSGARKGMDDLDPLLEIGPMLRYKAWKGSDPRQSVIIDAPIRAAIAIGNGVDYVGYAVTPRISYRRELGLLGRSWKWSISGEALWGSEGLHRYFYQVDPADATATRPAYDADAGYGGTRFRTSVYHRDRNKLISFYAVYDNVQGSVFEDSPLVERDGGFTVGFVVTWFLLQSDELVEVKQWEWNTE
jgi:outer membrane scaffolding protein for murein synthesis (MipA/OmpV family)